MNRSAIAARVAADLQSARDRLMGVAAGITAVSNDLAGAQRLTPEQAARLLELLAATAERADFAIGLAADLTLELGADDGDGGQDATP